MNARLIQLAERRATLIAQAANQRQTLAQATAPWRKPLAVVDHGISAIHYLRQYPALVAGSAAMMIVLRPRFLFRWGQRGWLAWRLLQGIRGKMSRP
ncbi:MAG: hypothetical protein GC139_06495 [Sideroxydans sp.]|nr:hypothetical protein [Sideroxydans sp.]